MPEKVNVSDSKETVSVFVPSDIERSVLIVAVEAAVKRPSTSTVNVGI